MGKKEKIIGGVKTIGSIASSVGAQALACGICRAVLPPGVNAIVQGGVLLGGLLLGGFVGTKIESYVDEQIDETVKTVDETVAEIKRCVDVIQDKPEDDSKKGEQG